MISHLERTIAAALGIAAVILFVFSLKVDSFVLQDFAER